MEKAQKTLKEERVDASAGGGMVKVVASGDGRLASITIDLDAVDREDVELLRDMILAAVNEALRAAQALVESRMSGMMGGLGGGLGLPGL